MARELDTKIALEEERTKLWKAAVLDDSLNAETMAMTETEEGFQKLRNEAIDVIRQIPGLETANISGRHSYHNRSAVRYIYMVKRGKLPHGHDTQIPISVWCCTDLEFSKKSMITFARWVEKTMQANGHANAKLYYSSRCSGAVNQYDKSVVFVWEPTMFATDGATKLSDRDIESNIVGESSEKTEIRNIYKIQERYRSKMKQ